MYSQPDGRLIWRRPFNAMFPVRYDIHKITRLQFDRVILIVKSQSCCAFQYDHKFMLMLVIPEPL